VQSRHTPAGGERRCVTGAESRACRDGETRTRTGDTTIFSRVLYQLSYLAAGREDIAVAGDARLGAGPGAELG
jgi:hypothetical protein